MFSLSPCPHLQDGSQLLSSRRSACANSSPEPENIMQTPAVCLYAFELVCDRVCSKCHVIGGSFALSEDNSRRAVAEKTRWPRCLFSRDEGLLMMTFSRHFPFFSVHEDLSTLTDWFHLS